jgi:predicted CXXCH cytochrome family protein
MDDSQVKEKHWLQAASGTRCLRAGMGLMLAMVWAGSAWGQVPKPGGPMKNCTEGQCHTKERNFKILHGPTALGACDVCHATDDAKEHTFKLKQKDKALCDFCHVDKVVAAKVMHKPVEEGKCLSCHNPHGSANKSMLRKDTPSALCADCHKDLTKDRKNVHGPVASGSCAACHNSHGSDHKKLLVAEGRELCLGCHDTMTAQLASVKFKHKPLEGECQACHEVHASNHMMQLKDTPLALCVSCHQPIKDQAMAAKYKHSPVVEGQACINCHTPHGSDLAKLMKSDTAKACLACHDKPVNTADNRVVAAVAEIGQAGLVKHGPIKDGNCSGCHNLHGSDYSRLLSKPYPETFYESFKEEKYALCFTCHDKQLVQLEKTKGLTNFRNGEQNLHFLHVNKADKGRVCRACHSTHASPYKVHVRETVPYGKWEMPMNFKPTASGGSCAPGCHQEYAYDRDKPVAAPSKTLVTPGAPAPGPTTKPSGTVSKT